MTLYQALKDLRHKLFYREITCSEYVRAVGYLTSRQMRLDCHTTCNIGEDGNNGDETIVGDVPRILDELLKDKAGI